MQRHLIGAVLATLASATFMFAQEGPPHQMPAPGQGTEPEHIFCPTMMTGQICTHGTAANLGLTGEATQEWRAIARSYNQRVNAATEQLFSDAEATLLPEQVALLKAWFAVGLNPEINTLLYGKGLYGQAAALPPSSPEN